MCEYSLMNLLQRCIFSEFVTMIVFHTNNTISKKRVYWSKKKHILVKSKRKTFNQSKKIDFCKRYRSFHYINWFDFSTKRCYNWKIRICIFCIDVCSSFAISIISRFFHSIDMFFEFVKIKLYEQKSMKSSRWKKHLKYLRNVNDNSTQ